MTATPEALMAGGDLLADPTLFDLSAQPVSLADRFLFPPFSVLDRRSGVWRDRKKRWLQSGIRSEVGRSGALVYGPKNGVVPTSELQRQMIRIGGGTSVFDPVVTELVYRWFCGEGAHILDPFAGGSVRGIVASCLDRNYTGIELRPEQVAANREQLHIATGPQPTWVQGDAAEVLIGGQARGPYDLLFTCPPYADLEGYSDDPYDLSNMPWDSFLASYRFIIDRACRRLRPDRFASIVIGDVRDSRGMYRNLVGETVRAFIDAGLPLYNSAVLLDPIGTAGWRMDNAFRPARKLIPVHQQLLVFVKGNPKEAAAAAKLGVYDVADVGAADGGEE